MVPGDQARPLSNSGTDRARKCPLVHSPRLGLDGQVRTDPSRAGIPAGQGRLSRWRSGRSRFQRSVKLRDAPVVPEAYCDRNGRLVFAGKAVTGFSLQLGCPLVDRLRKIERPDPALCRDPTRIFPRLALGRAPPRTRARSRWRLMAFDPGGFWLCELLLSRRLFPRLLWTRELNSPLLA